MRAWVTGGVAAGAPVVRAGELDGAPSDGATTLAPPPPPAPWLAGIDVSELSLVQRLLLTTDGTITHILEASTGDRTEIVKLYEAMAAPGPHDADLEVDDDEPIVRRRVVIRGRATGAPFIYAVSAVAVDRLPPALRHDLLHTDEPIGRLLFAHRAESLREILSVRREPAGDCAPYFGVDPREPALCRTYRILAGGKPVMLITEKFPATAFR